MSWTEVYIDSLKEWDKKCDYREMNLEDLLYFLMFNVGERPSRDNFKQVVNLYRFQNRIEYLINEEHFHEGFLIESLINATTHTLKGKITGQGEAIIRNENMRETFKEQDMPSEFIDSNVDRLKDRMYIHKVEKQLDVWNCIVSQNFSLAKKRELTDKYIQQHAPSRENT
ncbi:hypothetical protein AS52_03676 [Priestia megaterium Q3]|uniref:Uncharacterized protein n=1 Tax=Priestia megaterium Q3 TaxID=1452722 RepID=A0A806TUF7_PRIMG|nr:hypothetical protein [Priestia megaterium]AKP78637.1 hypothetical protein AS52_03676 [Priestia megaterium Q3]